MAFLLAEICFVRATDLVARSHVGFSRADRCFLQTARALVRANPLSVVTGRRCACRLPL
jgi:hypothetical protein